MLVSDGTMQYKVHERYKSGMNGNVRYELGLWMKQVRQKIVFMTVKNVFKWLLVNTSVKAKGYKLTSNYLFQMPCQRNKKH